MSIEDEYRVEVFVGESVVTRGEERLFTGVAIDEFPKTALAYVYLRCGEDDVIQEDEMNRFLKESTIESQ